jgi:hypothetical protein
MWKLPRYYGYITYTQWLEVTIISFPLTTQHHHSTNTNYKICFGSIWETKHEENVQILQYKMSLPRIFRVEDF